jgi:hypothetical protein
MKRNPSALWNGSPCNRNWLSCILLLLLISCSSDYKKLKKAFVTPEASAKPWVYWYWMNGNDTKEGVTADLEAMNDIGIGGALMMFIGDTIHRKGLDTAYSQMSPAWWNLVRHTFNEAKRTGVQVGMSAGDGWATAGGPMIDPEHAMKKLVWSLAPLEGGQQVAQTIPVPPVFTGTYQDMGNPLKSGYRYYRDIACYAIPGVPGLTSAMSDYKFTSQTDIPRSDLHRLFDGDTRELAFMANGRHYIQLTFDQPFLCRSIRVFAPLSFAAYPYYAASMVVESSQDGKKFDFVAILEPDQHSWFEFGTPVTFRIPETTARVFRLHFNTETNVPVTMRYVGAVQKSVVLSEIELSPFPWIDHFETKAAYRSRVAPEDNPGISSSFSLNPDSMINVSGFLDSTGTLRWKAPKGKWTILRLGFTLTGQENSPAGGGKGLESDKMNREATRILFNGWLGKTLDEIGRDKAGNAFPVAHVDSWEAGTQNWTNDFISEFRRRRGYDPVPWLPALAGLPVGSSPITESFLYDFRLTLAELMNDNFYGEMATLAHQNGLQFSAEATGPVMISDGMRHHEYVDLPMGEFWRDDPPPYDKPEDILEAVSGAHIYNHPIVQAESFTDLESKWYEHPFALKAQGDYNLCKGINKIFFHVYAQQPYLTKQPGMTLDHIGLHFNRGQTWWKQAKGWIGYITTCQSVLQKGHEEADILCFTGTEIPSRALLPDQLNVKVPKGYHYLCINTDALLHQVTMDNGKMKLPNGALNKILVLPDDAFFGNGNYSLELVRKLEEWVKSGLILVGPKPEDAIGLRNHDSDKKELDQIISTLWGDCNGKEVVTHPYGKGKVYWGESLENILKKEEIQPDLTFGKSDSIEYTHRKFGIDDIYFISNQENSIRKVLLSFRQGDRIPEIWNPLTKTIQRVNAYGIEKDRINFRVVLAPYESLFVVFDKPGIKEKHLSVCRHNSVVVDVAANSNLFEPSEYYTDRSILQISQPGIYELRFSDGTQKRLKIEDDFKVFPILSHWKISFEENRGLDKNFAILTDTLFSLTKHQNPDVKYFSGTAKYETSFNFDGRPAEKGIIYNLDLGKVDNIARVQLNGTDLGLVWTSPFSVDITKVLIQGENKLTVEVTNTWNNRIVRDMDLPLAERVSYFVHYEQYPKAGDIDPVLRNSVTRDLRDAGLSGPCVIRVQRSVDLN